MVGISILDYKAIRHFTSVPKHDNVVMLIVLTLTVFWSLLYAVGIGLVFAALIFMKKMADIVEIESQDTKIDRLVNQLIETFDDGDEFREHVYVKNLRGPMFFGFASRFVDSVEEIPSVKAVVFNFSSVNYMDQSGLYTFEEAVTRLVDRDINVCLSEASPQVLTMFENVNIVPNLIDNKHVFSSVEETIVWLREPGHLENVFEDDGELHIPSAYSPNGDGINDEWQLRNIEKYSDCIVRIYNREGVEIFYSVGYKVMWEGFRDGKMLPADRYNYEIDLYGDAKEVRKGSVTIFR
jgi:gliding motility-associated-like protein